jgi:pyruvate ferredoxin oxidoreductase delta subunit
MALNVGCAARPGKAPENRTGSWRVFKPVMHADRCSRCGLCVLICPESSIKEDNDRLVIDYDYCKGCGLCAEECPSDAIEMVQEEK